MRCMESPNPTVCLRHRPGLLRASFSHGTTGFRFSNHCSISVNASQPQDACSCECSELVERRWLSAVGMREHGPALLGSVAEPSCSCVWHVYDDLGDRELDTNRLNRE